MYMANSSTSNIEGEGTVVLNIASGKEVTLNHILYVPNVRKNLISGLLLIKNGFCIFIEADKLTLPKVGMFVGKGYVYRKTENKTAYEVWKVRKPADSHLKAFGVVLPRFLVYKYDNSRVPKNTIIESSNATFFENVFILKSKEEASSSKVTHESTGEEGLNDENIEETGDTIYEDSEEVEVVPQ
ncbi:hypothetical protein LIER_29237 [Lithospermum erythrorhizon]|uniref:Retrovirus-related Pol polyprotein from transposon TNT 1-94-like beta-barrel domain-containing protein n=1 Tax=Lithospermum erythrorhizon TaxID=34254 RepID=A0AAV3RK19_LITER